MNVGRIAWSTSASTVALLFLPVGSEAAGDVVREATRLFRQGERDEARSLLEGRIASHPDDVDAHLTYCELRITVGEREAARKEYAERLGSDLENRAIRLAHITLLPTSPEKENQFEMFLESEGGFARGWEEFGRYLVDRWKPREGIGILERAIELEPDRAFAHLYLGLAHRALAARKAEEQEIQKAHDLDPEDPHISLEWGTTLLIAGRTEEAVRMLEPLLARMPGDAYPPALLALAFRELGEAGRSKEMVLLSLKRDPTLFNRLVFHGIRLRSAGQREEAGRFLRMVVDLDPDHLEAYLQLGVLYRMEKDFDRAIETYAAATRLEKGSVKQLAWRNLGISYGDRGEDDKAEIYLRKALELDPDYLIGWVDLARILGRTGKVDEAIRTWNKVIGMAPYGGEAREAKEALAYLEKGELPPDPEAGPLFELPPEVKKRDD